MRAHAIDADTVSIPPLDPEAELAELKQYLGDDFDQGRLEGHMRALEAEAADLGEDRLYRESQVYLYDLTVFAMTGTKEPYLDLLARTTAPGARLLDYGCGIGSDGLRLLEAGYAVEFADFDNPSVRYLRHRLDQRGLSAPIHDLDAGPPPARYDLAYSFDVIEHVDDPFEFLGTLDALADRVLVNFLAPDPGETEIHHELPIKRLLRRAAAHDLIAYERHHGRSHLVLYGTQRTRGLKRLRSAAKLVAR